MSDIPTFTSQGKLVQGQRFGPDGLVAPRSLQDIGIDVHELSRQIWMNAPWLPRDVSYMLYLSR